MYVHVDLWAAISDHKMRDNWSVNGWVRYNWCHFKLSKWSSQKESAQGTAGEAPTGDTVTDAAAAYAAGDTQILSDISHQPFSWAAKADPPAVKMQTNPRLYEHALNSNANVSVATAF